MKDAGAHRLCFRFGGIHFRPCPAELEVVRYAIGFFHVLAGGRLWRFSPVGFSRDADDNMTDFARFQQGHGTGYAGILARNRALQDDRRIGMPVVMASTPWLKSSSAMSGVIPLPPAEFSPLAMMTSRPCACFNLGRSSLTARRPGLPTMSPMNKIFTQENLAVKESKDTKEK